MSVGLSVYLQCIVAKRLSGSGCRGVGVRVLDEVVIVEGEGAVLGLNLGRSIVTNWDFATRLFPNYFRQYLLGYSL